MRLPTSAKTNQALAGSPFLVLLVVLWALVASGVAAGSRLHEVRLGPDAEPAGEIIVCDRAGTPVQRFIGLGPRLSLTASGPDEVLVSDPTRGQVLRVRSDGTVLTRFEVPARGHRQTVRLTGDGGVLVAVGEEGVLEIDGVGAVRRQIPPPVRGLFATSAIQLADGSLLALFHRHDEGLFRLFHLPVGDRAPSEVELPVGEGEMRGFTTVRWLLDTNGLVLKYDQGCQVFAIMESPVSFVLREKLHVDHPVFVARLDSGDILVSEGEQYVRRFREGVPQDSFQVVYEPTSVVLLPAQQLYMIAYDYVEDHVWPDWREALEKATPFPWGRFSLWVLAGAIASGVLIGLTGRQRACGHDGTEAVQEVPGPNSSMRRVNAWLAVALVLAGIALAGYGDHLLRSKPGQGWLVFYVLGAVLAGVLCHLARPRSAVTQWLHPSGIAGRWRLPLWLGGLGLAGSALVFYWGYRDIHYADRVGLWTAMIIVVLIVCAGDPRTYTRRVSSHLPYLILPLLVGLVTIGYRLRDVPANCHFDFTLYVLSGLDLLDGLTSSIWENAFVPVPVIGTLPEMLGTIVAGRNELGFRLGNAVFCFSGIAAVYVLGTLLRGRVAGMLAGILTAGNLAFFHFSRLPSNGVSAVAALWVLALFAAALKSGSWRLWTLCGLMSGYTFLLWPVARVGPVAVFGFSVLVTLVHLARARRHWLGPVMLALTFLMVMAPVLPTWVRTPMIALPRVDESMTVFHSTEGWRTGALVESFGEPLGRSFSWFFNGHDRSTQGSLSPAFNSFESVLFSVGLVVVVLEIFSASTLLPVLLGVTLVTCGAWAGSPPWYTRLLPTAPVAALLVALALDSLLAWIRTQRSRAVSAVVLVILTLAATASSFHNFARYLRYETGAGSSYPMMEMVAIGRRMRELGPGHEFYFVTTHRPDWGIRYSSRFGELLPFIWDLRIGEIRDPLRRLPTKGDRPLAFVLQTTRTDLDLAVLREAYERVEVEEVRSLSGETRALLAIIR